MDLKTTSSAITMLRRIFDVHASTVPYMPITPQKPSFGRPAEISQPFERATPESQGIPSRHIAAFLEALDTDPTLGMHHVIILRGEKIVSEASFGAYRRDIWHITHSECKTIVGLAVGMLIFEGGLSLTDPVVGFFPDKCGPLARIVHRNLTVEHLLNMTGGVLFGEAGAITEKDWVRSFLESAAVREPGKSFGYNSMNTYMLGCIINRVTGQSLCEYLAPRLFEPMGITRYFWEKCQQGHEKGGFGLYMLPEDMAKLGQLVMDHGVWKGDQLVPAEWIEKMTSPMSTTPDYTGDYDYGYQVWVGAEGRSFLFNGMFGQNVMGFRDSGILVISNAENNELFQKSSYYETARRFFEGMFEDAGKLQEDYSALSELRVREGTLGGITPPRMRIKQPRFFPRLFKRDKYERQPAEICRKLAGKTFLALHEDTHALGLFPVFAQIIQNSYVGGLDGLSFAIEQEKFFVGFIEAGETYRLPVGFERPEYCELILCGEPHNIGTLARVARDEDGRAVLIIRVSFLEIACSRFLRLYLEGERMVARFSESPGYGFVADLLETVRAEGVRHPFLEGIIGRADTDYLKYKLRSAVEPVIELTCGEGPTKR